LEKSGKFSTRSLYRLMTFGGVVDMRMVDVWNTKIPLKSKIFCGRCGMTGFRRPRS
ncbi:hypothetical protein BAE44_0024912, partial [Dichanthelium oligosanthes]